MVSDRRFRLLWVVGVVVALNLIAWILADRFILANFRQLEEERIREQTVRALNILGQDQEYLRRMLVDEAYWDETYAFAAAPGSTVMADNFTGDTFESNRLSAVVVIAPDGKLLFSRGYDLEARRLAALPAGLAERLPALQSLLGNGQADSARAGLLFGGGGNPLMVAVAPILTTAATGPSRGAMIFARTLTPGKIEKLKSLALLDLKIHLASQSGGPPGVITLVRAGDETISGHVDLPGILGRHRGSLEVTTARTIYASGRASVEYFLGWVLATSLMFGCLFYWLLDHMARQSEKGISRYRLLFNGNPIPMWVYDAQTLQFADINDAAIAQYGYSRDEFKSLTILDLRPDSDAEVVREGVSRLIADGREGQVIPRAVGVWSHRRKDGSPLEAEVSVVPFRLNGRWSVLASALDVTEKLAAEKALRSSEDRYRQLFQNAPLPMWVVDMESLRYRDVNQTAIDKYGYSREEFLAMTIMDIRPPEEIERLRESVSRAKSGQEEVGNWRHRCKDGRILEVEIVQRDIPFAGRSARLVMANDVTEKENLRREADQASRLAALGELAAGVAHEINNPNGMILMNLGLLGDFFRDAEPLLEEVWRREGRLSLAGLDFSLLRRELPEAIAEMQKGARKVRSIVEDLKNFARPAQSDQFEPVSIGEIIEASLRLTASAVKKAGALLVTEIDKELPPVLGSFQRLEQVVINLLLNGCEALPEPGRELTVAGRALKDKGLVQIVVRDQGVGIRKEELPQIFAPFFTTKRDAGGTGLGLSVSDRIVREHGGKLKYDSVPGQGTTVTLTLPVLPRPKEKD
ncbi:hypothetical protein JCM30471_17530 [Desulfuromonas carbonis]